jgi:TfoX/Sxy family transcriptional regulator of competence genes
MYFKVNDAIRGDYEARGMGRFRPYPNKPHLSMTYYEVPADVLEDADECAGWARRSVAAAAAPKDAGAKQAARKRTAPRSRKRPR